MKLRNKRTGEKAEVEINDNSMLVTHEDGRVEKYYFDSLKDLDEWEDYEEPKGSALDLMILTLTNFIENEPDEDKVDLEECKKMLEKLKAWKRLKDKGFINEQVFSMNLNWCNPDDDDWKAFKLLFGGGE